MAKIIQISDLHLSLDNQASIESFDRVCRYLSKINSDLVVISGDMTENGDIESYSYIVSTYNQLVGIPLLVIPGNHDKKINMKNAFSENSLVNHIIIDGWLILALDSVVIEEDYGFITLEHLAEIQKLIAHSAVNNIIILIHHHLIPINSSWIDKYILKNAYQLLDICLMNNSKIKAVFHGHTHQESIFEYQKLPIYGTPSTFIQFKPNSDIAIPIYGQSFYRSIDLFPNGNIETLIKIIN